MGLLDAIPGLAAHQVEPPVVVPEFDIEQADRLVSDAMSLVTSLYPAGALEWLQAHRMDVIGFLKEAEAEVSSAAKFGDRARLIRALDTWVVWHRKAFAIFTERPPVLERQEAFFQEAV